MASWREVCTSNHSQVDSLSLCLENMYPCPTSVNSKNASGYDYALLTPKACPDNVETGASDVWPKQKTLWSWGDLACPNTPWCSGGSAWRLMLNLYRKHTNYWLPVRQARGSGVHPSGVAWAELWSPTDLNFIVGLEVILCFYSKVALKEKITICLSLWIFFFRVSWIHYSKY